MERMAGVKIMSRAKCNTNKCLIIKEMQDQIDDKNKQIERILKGYKGDKKYSRKIYKVWEYPC